METKLHVVLIVYIYIYIYFFFFLLSRFLILDPHYTGKDELKTIIDKVYISQKQSVNNITTLL